MSYIVTKNSRNGTITAQKSYYYIIIMCIKTVQEGLKLLQKIQKELGHAPAAKRTACNISL